MLFWLQVVFCSTPILDFNFLVDLENSSNYLKAFENKGLCENEEIQRKTQEMTKTENKYLDENPFDSNLLNDLADFIEENLNSMYKNVDYELCDSLSSTTAENSLVPPSCTRSTLITNVCKNQCCALQESRNDAASLKVPNSNENDTAEHSYVNTSWNDDTNLLLQKNQNDLMQDQYANSESNTFLQKNSNVLISSSQQTYNVGNNSINLPSAVQTDALFNVDILSTINNPESGYSFNNAYRNDIDVKNKGKRPKTNKVSNIQTNGNEKALKSNKKIKTSKATLKSRFTANERELYKKYKESEKKFRNFYKRKIKDRMPQFIKKLEISNLSDELKQRSIFALKNLLSFLDTINAIYINTWKTKKKEDFLNSLNLACYQFSKYADVYQKLLIFKLICNNLHKVNDSDFCNFSSCDFYEIFQFLFSVDKRVNSFYSRLKKLRDDFKKNDQH
ncbi:hypothetical protein AAJ76_2040001892 [Vairimorpha ceranae]|uniref:Uncharacterized protein n=1 Tax=Vairimorpha ceranae TaxID=40302 RepID=A0A0F9Z7D2_9MICR|nr:hypothetical protein AAJ76_2040001892 [Vairimorpha ceranae]KKO73849.1 hypothetical protein AAJ76_2040001892 [Vairimorpha ceranae]